MQEDMDPIISLNSNRSANHSNNSLLQNTSSNCYNKNNSNHLLPPDNEDSSLNTISLNSNGHENEFGGKP